MSTQPSPLPMPPTSPVFRRTAAIAVAFGLVALAYVLRGVLLPLFFAFFVAYALDPFVDWLAAHSVPRALAAILVMIALLGGLAAILAYAVPMFVVELRSAAGDLPSQLRGFEDRIEPVIWQAFHVRLPHTMGELGVEMRDKLLSLGPSMLPTAAGALFGTLSYAAVLLSGLIIPVFALYLLIDFDRIVSQAATLVPRRWYPSVARIARQIHRTLGGYVRGQLTANIALGALYATGLRIIDIRLAVPIGVLTGMLAFVPYIGFGCGLTLALTIATLDWQGPGRILGVLAVMLGVQLLDGFIVTPRIVGRAVGLAPIEVLLTMMAAGTLFGFLGVLLAVPIGAVVKILVQHAVAWYLGSRFYSRPSSDGM